MYVGAGTRVDPVAEAEATEDLVEDPVLDADADLVPSPLRVPVAENDGICVQDAIALAVCVATGASESDTKGDLLMLRLQLCEPLEDIVIDGDSVDDSVAVTLRVPDDVPPGDADADAVDTALAETDMLGDALPGQTP